MPNHYSIDKQLKTNWCWAAVTCSLARFYGKPGFNDQAALVYTTTGGTCGCDGKGCGECNRPWLIGEVLAAAGILQEAIPTAVSKYDLLLQLKMDRPVVIAVKWNDALTGHLLVLSELTADEQFIAWDSRGPKFSIVSYEELQEGFPTNTSWVNTFFTG